jgi:hypothetical protein
MRIRYDCIDSTHQTCLRADEVRCWLRMRRAAKRRPAVSVSDKVWQNGCATEITKSLSAQQMQCLGDSVRDAFTRHDMAATHASGAVLGQHYAKHPNQMGLA